MLSLMLKFTYSCQSVFTALEGPASDALWLPLQYLTDPLILMIFILCYIFVHGVHVYLLQYEIGIATADGIEILGPLSLDTNWDIAHAIR